MTSLFIRPNRLVCLPPGVDACAWGALMRIAPGVIIMFVGVSCWDLKALGCNSENPKP